MRTKFASLFAALLLVAACETTPDESASTSGAGETSSTTSGTSSENVTSTPVTPEAGPSDSTPSEEIVMAKTVMPGSQEDLVINVGDRVFFDFDRSIIIAASEKTLKRQAAWMRQNSSVTITVAGHADERGTREYNLALGARRATSVKNFLVALGISPSRIATISYGKERPDALGHTEAAWSQNRRGVSTVN